MNEKTASFSSFKELSKLKDGQKKEKQDKPKSRFEQAKKIIKELKSLFPKVFNNDNPLALALGIEKEILKLEIPFPNHLLKLALGTWTKREKYLLAVISGDHRYHLDGSIADTIKENEKIYSQHKLEEKRQKKAEQDKKQIK